MYQMLFNFQILYEYTQFVLFSPRRTAVAAPHPTKADDSSFVRFLCFAVRRREGSSWTGRR